MGCGQLAEGLKYHQGAILDDQRLGRVPDPYLQAIFEDIRDLRDQLARSFLWRRYRSQ